MKILSWNVNGLRAVYKKNFLGWLKEAKAEIVCLQEAKISPEQIPWDLVNPSGYFSCFNSATKPGYVGVAVYTKRKPVKVEKKIGLKRFDKEGRVLKLNLPHGGRGKENLPYKLEVYDYLIDYLNKIKDQKLILIGDFNIAHQEIDLARPKQNKNNYTWWPYLANARQRNLGWRIDYSFTSNPLTPKVKKSFILPEILGSDHCPIGIEIQ